MNDRSARSNPRTSHRWRDRLNPRVPAWLPGSRARWSVLGFLIVLPGGLLILLVGAVLVLMGLFRASVRSSDESCQPDRGYRDVIPEPFAG